MSGVPGSIRGTRQGRGGQGVSEGGGGGVFGGTRPVSRGTRFFGTTSDLGARHVTGTKQCLLPRFRQYLGERGHMPRYAIKRKSRVHVSCLPDEIPYIEIHKQLRVVL